MKTIRQFIFIFTLLFSPIAILSQTAGDIIVLNGDVPVESGAAVIKVSDNVDLSKNNRLYLAANYSYRIIRITDKIVELRALNFKDNSNWLSSESSDARNKLVRLQYNDKIYTISRINFNRFAVLKKDFDDKPERVSIGIITLPFKARFQEQNLGFDTEFNFNSTVSFRVGRVLGTSFNLQLGAGIGTVGLNKSNTKYLGDGEIQSQDVSTLTVLTGVMLEYEKIQVGLYLGWDHINNQKVFNWESNGDAWIGFGVGFSVFEVDLGNKQTNSNKED
jgi:hypothetical protein